MYKFETLPAAGTTLRFVGSSSAVALQWPLEIASPRIGSAYYASRKCKKGTVLRMKCKKRWDNAPFCWVLICGRPTMAS